MQTALVLIAFACLAGDLFAQPKVPDLTRGESPTPMTRRAKDSQILIGNLGPTGMKGWMYHDRERTDKSRQILVTEIAKGSPAHGILQVNDVILGVSGTGAPPELFSNDARRSFAQAIGEAEARDPAILAMIVWRDGETSIRAIELENMGAYSPTAPYNCPKSMKVMQKTLTYLEKNELRVDRFGLNILALLACNDDRIPGNAARMAKARKWILDLFPEKKNFESMVSDKVETYSKVAWNRTYHLITFAEYYLATGDNPSKGGRDLITVIDAHAQTVARGQSMFGTMGHQFAMQGEDGSIHGPYRVGYGPVNATGLAAFLGLVLAKECNLPNPETRKQIDAGIERAGRFFASYAGRGAIPYGEHPPWTQSHSANGKNGLAALAFARIKARLDAAQYFAEICVASGTERVGGHGGAYFNYMWTPLGANMGGEAAGSAFFKQASWHYDLSRTWEGGFFYHDFGNPGYNGDTFRKASLYMSSPCLMTYAMSLRKLIITGRDWNPSNQLSASEVEAAVFAGDYSPRNRSAGELIADLANFSPVVRKRAASGLAASEDASVLLKLHVIATQDNHPSRIGAIQALGAIGNAESAPILIQLFNHPDRRVREEAIEAFGTMPQGIKAAQVDTLLKMAAALKRPPMKVHKEDPVNTGLIALTELLFKKQGILGKSLAPVEKYSSREQLYEAIRAVATLPSGGIRGELRYVFDQLNVEDVRALGDTILELIYVEAPADAMFAENIRSRSLKLLLDHRFIEGVAASIVLFEQGGRWTRVVIIREWADLGHSLTKLDAWPEIQKLLQSYNDKQFKDEAKKALDAIAKQNKPLLSFKRLK